MLFDMLFDFDFNLNVCGVKLFNSYNQYEVWQ